MEQVCRSGQTSINRLKTWPCSKHLPLPRTHTHVTNPSLVVHQMREENPCSRKGEDRYRLEWKSVRIIWTLSLGCMAASGVDRLREGVALCWGQKHGGHVELRQVWAGRGEGLVTFRHCHGYTLHGSRPGGHPERWRR